LASLANPVAQVSVRAACYDVPCTLGKLLFKSPLYLFNQGIELGPIQVKLIG
jgi:hypothetical protein